MTTLIQNQTLQSAYVTQLPPEYLHSDDWYITIDAYSKLNDFEDDDELFDIMDHNLLSDGACQDLTLEIDRLFHKYSEPDIFSDEAINELKEFIAKKLDELDLSEVIVE